MQQLLAFTKGLKDQMKNPYFKAYFAYLEGLTSPLKDRDRQALAFFEDPRINFFDSLGFMARTLGLRDLIEKLQQIIQKGIEEGSIEVITLIGLKSPLVPLVLQSFVDNTGDIQTAAYIASYALVANPNRTRVQENVLKRIMQEYRVLLNTLQLWYARADFDVAFAQLQKVFSGGARSEEPPKLTEESKGENSDLFETYEDVSKMYKYGYSPDPVDKRPYSLATKCFYCQASFSIES